MGAITLYLRCVHANIFARLSASSTLVGLCMLGLALYANDSFGIWISATVVVLGVLWFLLCGAAFDTMRAYTTTEEYILKHKCPSFIFHSQTVGHRKSVGVQLAAHDYDVQVWQAHTVDERRAS